jgi:hypothetical protein
VASRFGLLPTDGIIELSEGMWHRIGVIDLGKDLCVRYRLSAILAPRHHQRRSIITESVCTGHLLSVVFFELVELSSHFVDGGFDHTIGTHAGGPLGKRGQASGRGVYDECLG